MSRGLSSLIAAQFLSAFSDNAILFTVIAIVLQTEDRGAWYVPALQSVFLVAFVILTPWVGSFADRISKPKVLILANIVKALGGLLILLGVEPLLGYAVVGVGAATYSPAKYGILPELADHTRLVKINSWIEGATIAAILLGTVIGAALADASIELALVSIVACYLVSAAVTLLLPRLPARGARPGSSFTGLVQVMKALLSSERARLVLMALSLFWSCAATLRVILVAWAPQVLDTRTAGEIAQLTLFLAVGIIIGSGIVPRLIPLEHVRRARHAAYALSFFFLLLASVDSLWPARATLLAIGVAGGLFVVPLNAAIQQIGHHSVGSGAAVGVQNFFQNAAMLASMGIYTFASAHGTGPVAAILALSVLVLALTVLVSWRLPRRPAT
ncbi:lysophospholipid transporter LplT [Methylocaldum marinum]|uniref:Lysophospholipid transporter LplT n=1 Tax=Methylocaldum marinum TaxID=1432792 RepID=A0A250KQA3_9GAMM|nr:lysophospholipid transporter LplT [Methylocaldum marinum]BBA33788.1 lysophospholipid transporter LplT [Methylocaldum marinum]